MERRLQLLCLERSNTSEWKDWGLTQDSLNLNRLQMKTDNLFGKHATN